MQQLVLLKIIFIICLFLSSTVIVLIIGNVILSTIKNLKSVSQQKFHIPNLFNLSHITLKPVVPKNKMFILVLVCSGFIIGYLTLGNIFWGVVLGIISFWAPRFIADYQRNKYLTLFEQQLVDGLVLISNSLRAGASLQQSIEVLVRESSPPISKEFELVLNEIKLGVPTTQAFTNICNRIPSKELRVAVTAINIVRETGGNLSEVLERLVSTMRERFRIQNKIQSLTAQGRLSGYIISALPFFMMFVLNLLDPTMMQTFFNSLYGYILLAIVLVMVALGLFVIQKIVSIDV